MWPMGWEALERWGADVARIAPLAGGVANDVWSVRVDGHLAVGRLGARSDADLAWETGLLQHLDREGLTVPVPIPTTDGRLFADGLVVMPFVEGGPPRRGSRLASRSRHAPPATSVDAGLAAAPGLALVDRPPARRDWDEDQPRRDAARGRCSLPSGAGGARRASDVRRARRPQPRQRPPDGTPGRAHRLGRGARRRPRPRP